MDLSIEDRISNLLDQLESPNLAGSEIEKIKDKIRFLQELGSRETE